MSGTMQQQKHSIPNSYDELILVVKRATLMPKPWQGLLKDNLNEYLACILQHQEFMPRSVMEQDTSYKQVIPYIIFTHENRYFLMQRRADASEKRLQNKYTLGIGGHIRQDDIQNADIVAWAHREFNEEISYQGTLDWQFIGLLNDDSNMVGQVHVGLVLLARGNSDAISIKSELKHGALYTLEECMQFQDSMETWSQLVFNYLRG